MGDQLSALEERTKGNDGATGEAFHADYGVAVIEPTPRTRPVLKAESVAMVGDLSGYCRASRVASYAGRAPVRRNSGRR
ncbi:transposase [Streptomyces sp. NPDC087843]|uniref:transposase n=1 Tax=Streptomyces sp. NPDC087843 TaxID=3365804 RepID=UPI00381956F7